MTAVPQEAWFRLHIRRDAFANNTTVAMDFIAPPGKKNGRIIRVWKSDEYASLARRAGARPLDGGE